MMADGRRPGEAGGSEDGAFEEEDEGASPGVSLLPEEEEESEATSVSSGDSSPPTPPANGCAASRPRPSEDLRLLPDPGVPNLGGVSGGDSPPHPPPPPHLPPSSRGVSGAGRRGGSWAADWPHQCPECGRGFGTSRALKVHRSYHGRKRPPPGLGGLSGGGARGGHAHPHAPPLPRPSPFHYICAECGLGFGAPAALGAHRCEHGRRRRHPQGGGGGPPPPPRRAPPPPAPPTPPPPPPPPPTYRCTECAGAFGLLAELHEHYMGHARGEL